MAYSQKMRIFRALVFFISWDTLKLLWCHFVDVYAVIDLYGTCAGITLTSSSGLYDSQRLSVRQKYSSHLTGQQSAASLSGAAAGTGPSASSASKHHHNSQQKLLSGNFFSRRIIRIISPSFKPTLAPVAIPNLFDRSYTRIHNLCVNLCCLPLYRMTLRRIGS